MQNVNGFKNSLLHTRSAQGKDRCGDNDDLKQVGNERNDVVRAATANEVQPLEGPGELPDDYSNLLEHRNASRRSVERVNVV